MCEGTRVAPLRLRALLQEKVHLAITIGWMLYYKYSLLVTHKKVMEPVIFR